MGRVLEKTKKPYEGIKFTRPLTCVASKFHIILLLEEYPVLFKGQDNIKDPMFKPSSLVIGQSVGHNFTSSLLTKISLLQKAYMCSGNVIPRLKLRRLSFMALCSEQLIFKLNWVYTTKKHISSQVKVANAKRLLEYYLSRWFTSRIL